MSLPRLWQQQGKRQGASLLAPIYHWFTKGFDTADLQEAKALLDALAYRNAGGHGLSPQRCWARVHNHLNVKYFHVVSAGNAHEYSLKSCIGEVRLLRHMSFTALSISGIMHLPNLSPAPHECAFHPHGHHEPCRSQAIVLHLASCARRASPMRRLSLAALVLTRPCPMPHPRSRALLRMQAVVAFGEVQG
jgi:hypothetical protein